MCAAKLLWVLPGAFVFFLEVGDVCGRIQRPGWVVNVGDVVGLFMSILYGALQHIRLGNEEQNLFLHAACFEQCCVLQCIYGIVE